MKAILLGEADRGADRQVQGTRRALTCLVQQRLALQAGPGADRDGAISALHMAINLRAPLLLAQALARQLPAGETGLIVNVLDQKLFNLNPDFPDLYRFEGRPRG